MNIGRNINKLALVKSHRKYQYLYTLDRLFTGQAKPYDVILRYNKLRKVSK